jgi:heme/copper-type cytochrome/quinol oxidase subunit 3
MRERPVINLANLPLHGMGSASPSWWGTLAYMLIEGTGFALALAVYLYLMSVAPQWPLNAALPKLTAGTWLTLLLLASLIPNLILARLAKAQILDKVRIGLVVMSVLGALPLVLRAYEFPAMQVKWDDNAYGSIVWAILALHTAHLITDLMDTLVLTALMFTRHADNPRRYGDVEDNAMYWNFIVLAWVPLYLCIYWVPRW